MMQITAHNKPSQSLKTDSILVISVTSIVLLVAAVLGNACSSILSDASYSYVPSSYGENKI